MPNFLSSKDLCALLGQMLIYSYYIVEPRTNFWVRYRISSNLGRLKSDILRAESIFIFNKQIDFKALSVMEDSFYNVSLQFVTCIFTQFSTAGNEYYNEYCIIKNYMSWKVWKWDYDTKDLNSSLKNVPNIVCLIVTCR